MSSVARSPSREQLSSLAAEIRRLILDHSYRADVGHIGSSLSIADVLAALFGSTLRRASDTDGRRDRFVLSKGHAALALYCALYATGRIDDSTLETFGEDGTILGTHPEHVGAGVDFSTGSLGQGLSFGVGAALAARLQQSPRMVFVLVSDAECNAGSLWEAVMFAAHHGLGNLVTIVDCNGQQALAKTRDVLDLSPLAERWRSFGWDAHELDGHDPFVLAEALRTFAADPGAITPRVVVARTVSGKGVSYMEGEIAWHYLPMSREQYARALEDITN